MRSLTRKVLASQYFVLYLSLLYASVMAPFTPEFLSAANAANLFASALPLLIVAAGQTVVVVTGGIDLSVTSTVGMASIVGAVFMTQVVPYTAAGVAAMLLTGIAIGLANGAAVSVARIPPFMATLITMMFFAGLAVWLTKSKNVGGLPAAFNNIGDSAASVALIAAGVTVSVHMLLSRTVAGRWLYAIGRNVRTAVASGVPVAGITTLAYVVSGALAGVAAVIYTGRLETGSPVLGQRILLDVIAAVVIGGASLSGGKGSMLWTASGVLFITLVDNTLNLLGVTNFTVLMAKGGVILAAALLDTLRTRYERA